jgi:uncharacterized membrane protein YqjE
MSTSPGAEGPALPEPPGGLQSAAGGFSTALVRFLQALTGLFGLELRETGGQALLLGLLAVSVVVASVLAYLFLLLGLTIVAVHALGGTWVVALFVLCVLHFALAIVLLLVLRGRATRPLFPGTREALRREVQRLT